MEGVGCPHREHQAQTTLRDSEILGQLGVRRLAIEKVAEPMHRLVPQPDAESVEAGQVVHVAELVDHRAAHADAHERHEARPELGTVVLDGLDQSPHSRVGQVLNVHGPRQARPKRAGHLLDDAAVALDELIAQLHGRVATVLLEQHGVLAGDTVAVGTGAVGTGAVGAVLRTVFA